MLVVFPDPVGPVNRMRPCFMLASSRTANGRPSSSNVGMTLCRSRSAIAGRPRSKKALTAEPGVSEGEREVEIAIGVELRPLLLVEHVSAATRPSSPRR